MEEFIKERRLITASEVAVGNEDMKEEDQDPNYVKREVHFIIPTTPEDSCLACPRSSNGTYDEFAARCQEAARRVITAHRDLQDSKGPVKLATHPLTLLATAKKSGGQVAVPPGVAVLHTRIEVVDEPFPADIKHTDEDVLKRHNHGFTIVVDPANEAPTKGRKKRPAVELTHAFDVRGGQKLGKYR